MDGHKLAHALSKVIISKNKNTHEQNIKPSQTFIFFPLFHWEFFLSVYFSFLCFSHNSRFLQSQSHLFLIRISMHWWQELIRWFKINRSIIDIIVVDDDNDVYDALTTNIQIWWWWTDTSIALWCLWWLYFVLDCYNLTTISSSLWIGHIITTRGDGRWGSYLFVWVWGFDGFCCCQGWVLMIFFSHMHVYEPYMYVYFSFSSSSLSLQSLSS